MRSKLSSARPALAAALLLAVLAGPAHAELTFNAGTTLSRDTNVNGSPDTPTKANQRGDNFMGLSASAVYFTPLDAAQTRYFIGQVGAQSTQYNQFSNLDSTMLMLSAGLYQQLSPTWSGQITGRGFNRETKQTERNSDGFGATLEIKNQLSETLWIKGIADHENNKANLADFSYRGETYGVNAGYMPLPDTFLSMGYSQSRRNFRSAATFKTTTQTVFADVTQRLSKNWFANAGYAFRDNDSNIAGTGYTSHMVTVGLNYSF